MSWSSPAKPRSKLAQARPRPVSAGRLPHFHYFCLFIYLFWALSAGMPTPLPPGQGQAQPYVCRMHFLYFPAFPDLLYFSGPGHVCRRNSLYFYIPLYVYLSGPDLCLQEAFRFLLFRISFHFWPGSNNTKCYDSFRLHPWTLSLNLIMILRLRLGLILNWDSGLIPVWHLYLSSGDSNRVPELEFDELV